ncbi:FecR family protein [Bordetella holmesii]|uniref:Sigma factor regulatory protein, FecR/PupR family n=3 Tax=Bordetella holmesii TaxID=35814 RepID=A0A158M100_9BORD|nr:FecR domain-containing protein [Bordetella holmesii]AHV92616.1 fecR family protein [Bordetella holmesii ATCC 51541]AIT28022.1 fecR family protein [Bordetella holmesii 44057]EWM40797.1 fecR family protein [Bordetella holmesii 35009]EWM43893.1 fecR family protein [Bordetella holmesii 41130]EWM44696.1 fecR family protein [Bordetella holmesii 70147]
MDASIERRAAQWVVRRNGVAPAALPDPSFEKWYRARDEHASCYDSIAELWQQMNHVDGPTLRRNVRGAQRRRALAALVCATLVAGLLVSRQSEPPANVIANSNGQVQTARLPDGSEVVLDAGAAIELDFRPQQRQIQLLRGRALFTVAPDAARPFVVLTPQARSTALGTRYEVDRTHADETVVSVLESHVRVECLPCGPGTPPAVLAPGQRVQAGQNGMQETRFDAASDQAWTEGLLLLRDVTLQDAVDQLSRYTGMRVWISTGLRELRISSLVTVQHPQALDTLARAAGAKVKRLGNWAWISRP